MAKNDTSSLLKKLGISGNNEAIPTIKNMTGAFEYHTAGGAGDDVMNAAAGRSLLSGGDGNDILTGVEGDDWLFGGSGSDMLSGDSGADRLEGNSGNDQLNGGAGDDYVDGGAGWDTASYSGSVLDYSFSIIGNSGTLGNAGLTTIVQDNRVEIGNDGTDSVRRVEELQFSDKTIYLDGRNNTPYAVADSLWTYEDEALQIDASTLLSNDWDFEGDTLTLESVDSSTNGSVTLNAEGKVVFTPAQNFSGIATFNYTISDGQGGTDTGTAQIQVYAVADAPLLSVTPPEALPGGGDFLHTAQTNIVTEIESNNTQAQASVIGRNSFTIATNSDLTDDNDPSVSVHGVISDNSDRDYYQFNFKAGESVIFDIDYGKPDVDTIISLYDAKGNQLSVNDDFFGSAHNWTDSGSAFDSYLTYTFIEDGDYALMVKPYVGFFTNVVDGDYQLNVSIDDATAQGGNGVQPVALDIQAALVDTDGSESISVLVHGLPVGALLSAGTLDQNGSWTLNPDQLADLTLTLPVGTNAEAMVVEAIATESENGSSAHTIIGGTDDNLILGGAGSDILTGGGGSDNFDFDHLSRHPDVITDFQVGVDGDVLNFSDLLSTDQTLLPLDQVIHVDETANGSVVSVSDTDSIFHSVVLLQNIYGITGQELAATDNIQLF